MRSTRDWLVIFNIQNRAQNRIVLKSENRYFNNPDYREINRNFNNYQNFQYIIIQREVFQRINLKYNYLFWLDTQIRQ